jgi:RND superfamily putative drug exporter
LLARRWVAWPTAILCLAGLGCAAWQLQYVELGLGQASDLPSDSAPHRGADAASAGFVPGILSPTSVIIQAPGIATEHRSQLVQLQRLIDARPEVAATLGPGQEPVPARFGVFYASGGAAARIVVILKHDPLGASGIDDLDDLEAAMPGLVARSGLTGSHISYAGDTPLADDTVSAIGTNTVRVIAVVLVVNLLLLIVFLRSVVAPLFLLGSSVIAVAASLGLTTWVFQSVLGYGQLTYFVPFIVSVLLISLGSDYNIFVVGRIWQEANLRPLPDAVAIAAPSAARAVRAAGTTLAASFAIVAVIPIRSFREIAFAMVTGVLIETFVVRSLLAPSLITVFGYVSGWPGRRLHPGAETPVHDA